MSQKQQNREVKKRHYFNFWFFRTIFRIILRLKYHYIGKKNKIKKGGPYLILCNHTVPIDPLCVSLSFNFPVYFVSTDQIFNLGFISKALKYLVNPIPKSKSLADFNTIRRIKRIVNEGGSIGLFPEGNVTYTGLSASIPNSLGKLIKFLNIPVIIWHSNGLYFSNPRWSKYSKRGKAQGSIQKIIQPNEFAKLSEEEIFDIINRSLKVNAYEKPITNQYHGKKIAEGLERLIFMCPDCHSLLTTKTKNNQFYCTKCSYHATYLPNCYLEDTNGLHTLIDMDLITRQSFLNYLIKNEKEISFTDDATLKITTHTNRIDKGSVKITLDNNGIDIRGPQYQKMESYSTITALAIQGKHKLIVYFYDGEVILINFSDDVSPYKYLLTFQFFKHRINKGDESHEFIKLHELGL